MPCDRMLRQSQLEKLFLSNAVASSRFLGHLFVKGEQRLLFEANTKFNLGNPLEPEVI
jgi:hypothetical protein